MITSVNEWFGFLRSSDTIIGFPLLVVGIGLMLFGWRMWRVCVVLSFGLAGMGIGYSLADSLSDELLYAVGCGAFLALFSYYPVNYSLSLVGGAIGAAFLVHTFEGMGLNGPVLWILGGIGLFGTAALAFINRQLVVIGVTSFLGAVLLMSGLAALLMSSPAMHTTLRGMLDSNAIVLPFVLLVPTVMSGFYQIAEIHRINAEL